MLGSYLNEKVNETQVSTRMKIRFWLKLLLPDNTVSSSMDEQHCQAGEIKNVQNWVSHHGGVYIWLIIYKLYTWWWW